MQLILIKSSLDRKSHIHLQARAIRDERHQTDLPRGWRR